MSKKMFDKASALAYAYIKFSDDTHCYRSSVEKWDAYSLRFTVKKLKEYIMRTFPEHTVKVVVIYDNFTRAELDRMIPGTSSWNNLLPNVTPNISAHGNQSQRIHP